MIQNKKHFSVLNKKSFTLIEVLISISILFLVFVFIYSQFNLAQLSTKKTTLIEKQTTNRAKLIQLLYNDFITSKNINPRSGKSYDTFIESFSSENSLYGIDKPFIKYAVTTSPKGNILVRLESASQHIDLENQSGNFYIDVVLDNVKFFKVLKNGEYIEFYVQSKGMKDIYFKFKRFYK